MFHSTVDGVAVPSVFLADGFYNGGILFLVALRDRLGSVAGSVIDYDDLYIFPAYKDGVNGFFYLSFRIITRYCESDIFHFVPPHSFLFDILL